ncbi:MAG: hypothetical protein A2Z21_06070 [Candidatus Fraserbacteria bacterium RBG_16_55_9]|uniref:Outer membrane protein beta-barrel domain-containing protein n=1 Tax=Fraserbacteria sp. (strain RBG_16_55_9) TaxID=1817864 RepID=A0A1F5V2E1_FRAXR|nr:MAG: hypothetical protein A2Z21_06070 [Candidatus Fraserbacteria bacterium RBG_16_55_9]
MTIHKDLTLFVLTIAGVLALMTLPVMAAVPEVGIKVPLAGLASVSLNDQLRLEASAVIPGFSAPLVSFEGTLAVKVYPGSLNMGDLQLSPFVGGGAKFFYAVGEMVPALVALAGIEHGPHEGFPLTIFAEGSGTYLMIGSAPTLFFQLGLGARYQL